MTEKGFTIRGQIEAPFGPLTEPSKFDADRKPDRRQVWVKVDSSDPGFLALEKEVHRLGGENRVIERHEKYGTRVKASCKNALRGKLHCRDGDSGDVDPLPDSRLSDFRHGSDVMMHVKVNSFPSKDRGVVTFGLVVGLALTPPATPAYVLEERERRAKEKAHREKLDRIFGVGGGPRARPKPPPHDPDEVTQDSLLDVVIMDALKNRVDWLGDDGEVFRIHDEK